MNSTLQDQKKRLNELKKYLKQFSIIKANDNIKINYKNDAAEMINSIYFKYADNVIRPALEEADRIQVFKIVANTELAVLFVMPIIHENSDTQIDLNCEFAFFIAFNLLIDWDDDREGSSWVKLNSNKCMKLIDMKDYEKNKDIISFLDEHIKWLISLDPKFYYPIFSNSQVWRLFYYLLRDRSLTL